MSDKVVAWVEKHWRLVVLLVWLGACAWLIWQRWGRIQSFGLGDTDDNLRIAQVRAWLQGQGWYDLRQYRFDPAFGGANIHWSRIVDLPIAALITVGKWFMSGAAAERMAVAVAPLLPYLVLLGSIAVTARRLIGPGALIAAFLALFFAGSTNGMFMPTRIDHHGWQLAMLSLVVAGLADPRPRRGGVLAGLAAAVSLSIGLEMLIYLAMAAAFQVLMWVADPRERDRILAFGASLALGCGVGFAAFASYANRLPVCDALSPVWLSDALLGGGLLLLLAAATPRHWTLCLGLAAGAGLIVAAFHALAWPQCLSRLEGVSPEVQQLWLNNVREARPVTAHNWQTMLLILGLPGVGLLGWALLIWERRRDPVRLRASLAIALIAATAFGLLFWQTRAAAASQLLGVIGGAALITLLLPRLSTHRHALVGVLGSAALVLVASGAITSLIIELSPQKPEAPATLEARKRNNRANALCPTLWALRPVAKQPKGVVFTFIDLGPRLIAVTHHSAIGGPYHRNGQAIADSMLAFRGSPERARALISKHQADYLLICPYMNQATVFKAAAPRDFYSQLERGVTFPWLQPIDLGKDSPLRMWRVLR